MKTEAIRPFPKLLAAIKLGIAVFASQANGQTNITPEQASFFKSKIRPVLVDSCYECHSKEAGQKKGGLSGRAFARHPFCAARWRQLRTGRRCERPGGKLDLARGIAYRTGLRNAAQKQVAGFGDCGFQDVDRNGVRIPSGG